MPSPRFPVCSPGRWLVCWQGQRQGPAEGPSGGMNQEQLEKLRIRSEAKRRPQGMLWGIFLGVILVTGAAVYLAWPRATDDQRIFGKNPLQHLLNRGSNEPASLASTNTAAVPRSTNDAVLTVSGYIVCRERIAVSPRFMGVVKWIGVKKGDAVTNQQVLVLLDDAEQKARVAEAESQLANARISLSKAEIDYTRLKRLIADKVETPANEDDFRLRVEAAKASVRVAEAQVDLQRTYLDWTVIRSPVTGVVLEKLVQAGELVMPQSFGGARGPSTAVVAVADPNDLQVECDLNEADVAKVCLGQQCRISPEAYPDKRYTGFLAEMAPEANRQKGTLQVKVQIRQPDRYLTPELSAKVEFQPK